MKKRAHLTRRLDGALQLDDCPGSSKGTTKVLSPVQEGKPLIPGRGLLRIEHTEDGHVEYEEILPAGSGPPQVATDAYRRGYDETFGKKCDKKRVSRSEVN